MKEIFGPALEMFLIILLLCAGIVFVGFFLCFIVEFWHWSSIFWNEFFNG